MGKDNCATCTTNVYGVSSFRRVEPEPDFGIDFPFNGRVLHTSSVNPTITVTVNASINVRIKIARHCSWKEMHSRMSILLITIGLASNGRTMYPYPCHHLPPFSFHIALPQAYATIPTTTPITKVISVTPLIGNTYRYMVHKDCDSRLCHREYQEHQ